VILILSNPVEDAHIEPVTTELSRMGREFRVFDPATYPKSATATLEGNGKGVSARLRWDEQDLKLSDVKAIWYRRPGDFVLSSTLLREEDEWVRTECSHFFRAIWENTSALWVSAPDAIRKASLKGMQLKVAAEFGFRVPRFVVTNEPDAASRFISACPSGAIVKTLAKPAILRAGYAAILYTHLITDDDLEQLYSVRFGPTFIQEFIEKKSDIRVTVVGRQVFAVAIQSSGVDLATVDFRRAEVYDLPHEIIALPDSVQQQCIELVAALGLSFGAIDLLCTPDDTLVFLEINPNGQWYWLEWVTGVPISKAMCDLLTRPRFA
jgi:glutathione synthase/RimK-type ligase-like ATP-grasp enzyme